MPLRVSYAFAFKNGDSSGKTSDLISALENAKSFAPGTDSTASAKTRNVLLYERGAGGEYVATAYGPSASDRFDNTVAGEAWMFSKFKMTLRPENNAKYETLRPSDYDAAMSLPIGRLLKDAFTFLNKDITTRISQNYPELIGKSAAFTYVVTLPKMVRRRGPSRVRKVSQIPASRRSRCERAPARF